MAQPPNEELSALAQQLLKAHRDETGPEPSQEDRVWQRVHHSAFVAPVALLAEPLSQVAGTGASATKGGLLSSAGAGAAKAGSVAAASKGGMLSALGLKILLATTVTTGLGAGALAWQMQGSKDVPPPVTLPDTPSPSPSVPPQLKKEIPNDAPLEDAAHSGQEGSTANLELTPELRAQLGALSAIDEAIRVGAFQRARTRISRFDRSYANSPFASDLAALKTILECRSKKRGPRSKVRRMLQDPSVRRYWFRIKNACQR